MNDLADRVESLERQLNELKQISTLVYLQKFWKVDSTTGYLSMSLGKAKVVLGANETGGFIRMHSKNNGYEVATLYAGESDNGRILLRKAASVPAGEWEVQIVPDLATFTRVEETNPSS